VPVQSLVRDETTCNYITKNIILIVQKSEHRGNIINQTLSCS